MQRMFVGARAGRARNTFLPERLEERRLLSGFTVTNLNDSGPGSLRQAILDTNNNSGPDDITFAAGLNGILPLRSGELQINDQTTITAAPGQQIVIDANYTSRIFDIATTTATIQNLTIEHGQTGVNAGVSDLDGGGILNDGSLTLIDDIVTQCRAADSSGGGMGQVPGGWGGGIRSGITHANPDAPILNVLHCTISDNSAGNTEWEADGGNGGGIAATGKLVVHDSTIIANTAGHGGQGSPNAGTLSPPGMAGQGGGIYYLGSSCLIANCTITANSAGKGGFGGFSNFFVGNGTAGGAGGGIYLDSGVIENSTIANNAAGPGGDGGNETDHGWGSGGAGGYGGGIYTNSALLINDTVTGNTAGKGGAAGQSNPIVQPVFPPGAPGGNGFGDGILVFGPAPSAAAIGNTIVAGNLGKRHQDVNGPFLSNGHNLVGVADGSTGWVASDQTGTAAAPLDPKLAPLNEYGGPTQTMALLAGSPALDHGDNALIPAGVTTDQRGLARIFNGAVDIGAYEAQPPHQSGDVNHDGQVDFADLLIVAQHYGQNVPLYEQGDLTGDGNVQFSDLLILAQNYGASTAAAVGTDTLLLAKATKHRR